jgi:hypothetical protein
MKEVNVLVWIVLMDRPGERRMQVRTFERVI